MNNNAKNNVLTDIRPEGLRNALRQTYSTYGERPGTSANGAEFDDIGTVSGHDNLVQAIIMRLLTSRGELGPLGHPEYGSNLHELRGMRNNDTTRALIRLHIVESLSMEPRIAAINAIQIESDFADPSIVNVQLEAIPIDEDQPVTIGPFALEFEI